MNTKIVVFLFLSVLFASSVYYLKNQNQKAIDAHNRALEFIKFRFEWGLRTQVNTIKASNLSKNFGICSKANYDFHIVNDGVPPYRVSITLKYNFFNWSVDQIRYTRPHRKSGKTIITNRPPAWENTPHFFAFAFRKAN